eukprot:358308-Chlamydomonas_euryale.AAC.2
MGPHGHVHGAFRRQLCIEAAAAVYRHVPRNFHGKCSVEMGAADLRVLHESATSDAVLLLIGLQSRPRPVASRGHAAHPMQKA